LLSVTDADVGLVSDCLGPLNTAAYHGYGTILDVTQLTSALIAGVMLCSGEG
jgi:hypothetical protein